MTRRIRIAIIGMGFGRCFVPIYRDHPGVSDVGICDGNADRLQEAAAQFPGIATHRDLSEVISSKRYDAVHIMTRVDQHAGHCLQAMAAGLHCASAVPMGLSLSEIRQVVDSQRRNRVTYMMMETAIYSSEYLYAKDLMRRGAFGEIQFLQGYHSQDLSGLPQVWKGFPPMWYITHALSPLLDVVDRSAKRVFCLASGHAREGASNAWYTPPSPIATAVFRLRDSPVTAQITRTLFDVAPYGGEGFNIWGSQRTLITAGETREIILDPVGPQGSRTIHDASPPQMAHRPDLLPAQLQAHASGGHGGSHPHLVHEFMSSILEGRDPYIDVVRAANWCAPGICAHQSMLADGEGVDIPYFS